MKYYERHVILQLFTILLPVIVLLSFHQQCYGAESTQQIYRDPEAPVQRRVEDLLQRMTLAEKIGQLNMPCVYLRQMGETIAEKQIACRSFTKGTYVAGLGPGGGFFTLPNNILINGPEQQAEFLNDLQKIAVNETRLGIPLLQTEEGTHGLMCSGATIFPEGPALGSTWNLELISDIYAAVAREGRAIGVHQLFTLVIEPIRDPRLGRNQEAYSEDSYLCACMAESIVRAIQGDDISSPERAIAGLCHYPGQSQPVSGLERGAMEISERVLREVFLPPWVAGIKKAGARGVMATYPSIDGVPVHASGWILTDLLRGELGFKGLVLSEGEGIETLVYEGLAASQKQAGELAIKAGVDVGISYEPGYMELMLQNVEEGRVSVKTIDRAVKRILKQKFDLGLFENHFVDPQSAKRIVHSTEHQDLALKAAREGIVLLKNDDDLLPISKDIKTIAVIGPNADHVKNQLGDYTSITVMQEVVTVLKGIRQVAPSSTRITYTKGCDVQDTGNADLLAAKTAALQAQVAVVVVGENEWRTPEKQGTVGEAYDSAILALTGLQEELIRTVYETGTPTIVVLINGRPLCIGAIAEYVPAIVEAWNCGEKGGIAVADVLFGNVNPSGKLPVTMARHAGQLPVYYNYKKSKRYWLENAWGKPYVDMDPTPLYPFGHGLSYTEFEYSNLQIGSDSIGIAADLEITVDISNAGDRYGEEVVQLYLEDLLASVAMPVKSLQGFVKMGLKPGETKSCTFWLTPEHLSLWNQQMRFVVEPGDFKVMVGGSSKDIRLEGVFTVRGS